MAKPPKLNFFSFEGEINALATVKPIAKQKALSLGPYEGGNEKKGKELKIFEKVFQAQNRTPFHINSKS